MSEFVVVLLQAFMAHVFCDVCPRYPAGSVLPEQHHMYSVQGLLDVRLIFNVIYGFSKHLPFE